MSSASFADPTVFRDVTMSSRAIRSEFGATGELQPAKFFGITISKLGDSRKNPWKKLKAVALDPKVPIEDRMRAVRYMDRVPHINRLEGCLEAAKSIINYEDCPIGQRYYFFSTNEKIVKLGGDIVKACHAYFFTTGFERSHWPLILRLLSGSQIYMTERQHLPIWTQAREFILKLAIDPQETVRIRAEAADILCRCVTMEDAVIGRKVIADLGDLYMTNKMTTVYSNAQNAHDNTITESVMAVIRALLKERNMKTYNEQKLLEDGKLEAAPTGFTATAAQKAGAEQNTGHIAERLIILTKDSPHAYTTKVFTAFNFVVVHPAKYEGITPSDLLCLIWNKAQNQKADIKKELEKRLVEELHDMIDTDGACSTGIVGRLVNVIQGYIQEEGFEIKMSIKDQLRANVFARLQANMKVLPERDQEEILNELAEDTIDKPMAREFVITYSVKAELEEEFVLPKLVDKETFDGIYRRCLADFLGLEEDQLGDIMERVDAVNEEEDVKQPATPEAKEPEPEPEEQVPEPEEPVPEPPRKMPRERTRKTRTKVRQSS